MFVPRSGACLLARVSVLLGLLLLDYARHGQAASASENAYIIPLQLRTGVVRSRDSGGRHLLGAGKVQVGGR